MGFFARLFGRTGRCPHCDTARARVTLSATKCQSRSCQFYDPDYARQCASRERKWEGRPPVEFRRPVQVQYVNFRGESQVFAGELSSVRVRRAHLSLCVQPTGRRIALSMARIGNLEQISAALKTLPPRPTPREARVLRYHTRRGTTSPLHESLRAKYPDN